MGIINTNIVEDNFTKNDSSKYNLSMLIGMDRFSYAILDSENNLLALKSYLLNADLEASKKLHAALQDIFVEDKLVKLPYQKVTVGLLNNKSTLVPNRFYESQESDTYLANQVHDLASHQVFVDDLNGMEAKNIYAFDQEVYFLVKGFLPNAQFFHSHTSVVKGFSAAQNNGSEKNVFVNVKGDHLQIALLEGKNLVFFNAFPFQDENDFIYHVMLIFQQFNLSAESTPLFLSGQITENSKIYRMLYRYINQINFVTSPASIRFGKKYAGTPAHFYFDLFSLELCES